MNRIELEERLINFAVMIVDLTESMTGGRSAQHLSGQLLRSGTSPALNYGEAQSAESARDFIHKIQIVLKELRETNICLKIIGRTNSVVNKEKLEAILKENNELISIFVKTVSTAQKNQKQPTLTSEIENR